MRKQLSRQLELFPNHSPESHSALLDGHRASVELFDASVKAVGGGPAVTETLPVDGADLNKMRKLHRDGYPVRFPQLGIVLALAKRDPDARAAATLKFDRFVGNARAPLEVLPGGFTRDQVLQAFGEAALRAGLVELLSPSAAPLLGASVDDTKTAAGMVLATTATRKAVG